MKGDKSKAIEFVRFVRDRYPATFTHQFSLMPADEIKRYYMAMTEAALDYLYENSPEGEVISKETFYNALVSIRGTRPIKGRKR